MPVALPVQVSSTNFGFNVIGAGLEVQIPEGQQMIVFGIITIDGILTIDGEVAFI